jgi:hypothetical protein
VESDKTSIAGAIHDLQARLGSIRIAVTAVVGLDLDEETESMMLTSAAEETVRASAELACVGALMKCFLDESEPAACDIAAALDEAAQAARMANLDVRTAANGGATVNAATARLQAGLPALIRLVSGAGNAVVASVTPDGDRIRLSIRREGPDAEALPPIAGYLVDALGGEFEADDEGVTFSLAAVR